MSRRELFRVMGVAGAALLVATQGLGSSGQALAAEPLSAVLPPLPYAYDALDPFIDTLTMQIHHTRHHAGYVNNLVAALRDHSDLQSRSLAELLANLGDVPAALRDTVRNNGGGHINHSIFWATLAPPTAGGGGDPAGALAQAIAVQFGSAAYVKALINEAGARRFGSGWAWLAVDGAGQLLVYSTPNQDTPYMQGHTPLLGIDVWEHAYYLRYQNRRADYLEAFWNVLNWHAVEQRYEAARERDGIALDLLHE